MACSRLLLGNHDRLLMQMIEHGRPLMALATMMYSDITITEVCMYVRTYVCRWSYLMMITVTDVRTCSVVRMCARTVHACDVQ